MRALAERGPAAPVTRTVKKSAAVAAGGVAIYAERSSRALRASVTARARAVTYARTGMLRALGAVAIRQGSSSSGSSRRRLTSMSASVSRSLGGGPAPVTLRVVTFNVLCSHLGGPDYFTACDPAALAPATRLARVMAKLHAETERGSLLCLQEVSMTWTGPLTKARPRWWSLLAWIGPGGLSLRGGGNPDNRSRAHRPPSAASSSLTGTTRLCHTCMARPSTTTWAWVRARAAASAAAAASRRPPGIAYPSQRFAMEACEVSRVADSLPRARRPPPPTGVARLTSKLWEKVAKAKELLTGKRPAQDEWAASRGKFNSLVCLKLRCTRSAAAFALATYHMPCAFYAPKQMTIHCGLAAQKALQFAAASPPTPLILAGDFNIRPASAQYALLTRNEEPVGDDAPDRDLGVSWSPRLSQPLRSAYAEAHGAEPAFTNWSKVKEDPEFIDTLDYVFVGEGVQVLDADALPGREELAGGGPLPTGEQPSDHLLLAVTLRI